MPHTRSFTVVLLFMAFLLSGSVGETSFYSQTIQHVCYTQVKDFVTFSPYLCSSTRQSAASLVNDDWLKTVSGVILLMPDIRYPSSIWSYDHVQLQIKTMYKKTILLLLVTVSVGVNPIAYAHNESRVDSEQKRKVAEEQQNRDSWADFMQSVRQQTADSDKTEQKEKTEKHGH